MDIKEIFRLLPDATKTKVPNAMQYGPEQKLIIYPDGSGRVVACDIWGEDTSIFTFDTFDELYEFVAKQ